MIRDLAVLVFGLSKKERTEFEQYANRQGGDLHYMRVYKDLVRILAPLKSVTEIPKEDILAVRLRKGGNTTAYCSYLYKVILRSLRSTHDTAKKEDEIFQDINNAKILFRRGLFDSAILSLNSAYDQSKKYEYHALTIQALRELVYLEGQRDSKSYAGKIRERLIEITELADLQKLESHCFRLHHRAFLLTRAKWSMEPEEITTELKELKSHPLLSGEAPAKSFFAQVYYWQANASLANMEGNGERAYACSKNIVERWQMEEYAHLQEEHPRLYIIHLHNLVGFAITSSYFDVAELYLDVMEKFPCDNFDDAAEQFQNVLFSRQLLLLNTGRYSEAIAEVTGKLDKIEGVYSAKINTARLISWYYNTLAACFALQDYQGAWDWSDRIYQIGRTEQRGDIQVVNKVLQIIIRFELGEVSPLIAEIRNAIQNLRDHNQLDKTNMLVLQWLAKLVKNRHENSGLQKPMLTKEKTVFNGLKETLLMEKKGNIGKQVLGLDEILMWVEGHLMGK